MLPILYSFRRCPYAMRARLAIAVAKQQVRLREIVLKHKPAELLAISPNKTIPVLQLDETLNETNNTNVVNESLDIMLWALNKSDPQHWLNPSLEDMLHLIQTNDHEFKPWLDKYKYADRFPEYTQQHYREQSHQFLLLLESRLHVQQYLFADHATLADMAIFPFIRQFAAVDKEWFEQSPYPKIRDWLNDLVNGKLFQSCMQKYATWLTSGEEIIFP
ncbi:glutathione S-transferase [Psychromonas sp. RZ22]|uniref:glutathione S-transferase n=1 Tax=Psychromonas algarum TaxID=2555643 RepID=UPI001067ECBF|nr:glutathione S-transferase [Psychromonas sp. RZ22]TEW54948.1 glutathione S-transferase [Psychromonas sp. RZ22]